jgi:hypothetical protein
MTEGPGDRDLERRSEGDPETDEDALGTPPEGLSLMGDEGRAVAINVARIALGKLRVSDLNDARYGLTRDGALSLELNSRSFEAVQKILKS